MLRDSSSRFFAPQYSGNTHEFRQNVLVTEGILEPKYTSVLQLGKKDIMSYGVEEQFSKSEYTSKSSLARTGLFESRQPGAFTPRKQFAASGGSGGVAACLQTNTHTNTHSAPASVAYNPSGDPRVLSKWGKGVDLDVRASASMLPPVATSMFGGSFGSTFGVTGPLTHSGSESTLHFSQPVANNRVVSNIF